jgi:hypothetical protein
LLLAWFAGDVTLAGRPDNVLAGDDDDDDDGLGALLVAAADCCMAWKLEMVFEMVEMPDEE